MPATSLSKDQAHPLEARDRVVVKRLLTVTVPTDQDLVDTARLLTRYRDFPGARDIGHSLVTTARQWGFGSRDELNAATRAIWARGFRPQSQDSSEVGSGADVQGALADDE